MRPLEIPLVVALVATGLTGLAAAPLTAQQETGADDFRISTMGGSGDVAYRANSSDVAYNATEHEYFVVWAGDTNTGGEVDDRYQIFGRRIDAATGSPIGGEIQLTASPFIPSF
ncbi:MAG: hypothetical protein ABIV06_11700, partial [Thermoanaerobaculia bacterium]